MRARLAHHEVHAELGSEVRCLVRVRCAVLADHLLQPRDVGRDLGDHVGDAVEVEPAVEADAAVDVVGEHRERNHAAPR